MTPLQTKPRASWEEVNIGANMERIIRLLESYRGRDKVIRLCGYTSMLLASSLRGKSAGKFAVIAKELSGCRVILRLFDDLSMLGSNLVYGLGSKEPITAIRILQLIGNAANQLFYPIEHIYWLGDKGIVDAIPGKWLVLGLMCWAVSLATEIVKNILRIFNLRSQLRGLKKQQYLEASEERNGTTEQSQDLQNQNIQIQVQIHESSLILCQSLADFMNAINWIPGGMLWSGKLSQQMVGTFGLISTLIMLYRIFPAKLPAKRS